MTHKSTIAANRAGVPNSNYILQGSFPDSAATLAHRATPIQMSGGGGRRAWQLPPSLMLPRSGGEPMATDVRQKMEGLFRSDFSTVRIHSSPQTQSMGALALTMGESVHFAPGRYNPKTPHGLQLLGHELAHVVQQRAGRVKAPGSGMVVLHDPILEAEADRFGRQAHILPSVTKSTAHIPATSASSRSAGTQIYQPLLLHVAKEGGASDLDTSFLKGMAEKGEQVGELDKVNLASSSDTTLTLNGHAGQDTFGDYTPEQLAALLMNKGFMQSSFTTIELMGCAATSRDKGGNNYLEKFTAELYKLCRGSKKTVAGKTRPIIIRGLPEPDSRNEPTYSHLLTCLDEHFKVFCCYARGSKKNILKYKTEAVDVFNNSSVEIVKRFNASVLDKRRPIWDEYETLFNNFRKNFPGSFSFLQSAYEKTYDLKMITGSPSYIRSALKTHIDPSNPSHDAIIGKIITQQVSELEAARKKADEELIAQKKAEQQKALQEKEAKQAALIEQHKNDAIQRDNQERVRQQKEEQQNLNYKIEVSKDARYHVRGPDADAFIRQKLIS